MHNPTLAFGAIGLHDILQSSFTPGPIKGDLLRHRVLFVRTPTGHFAKLRVDARGSLRVHGGTVYSKDGRVVRVVEAGEVKPGGSFALLSDDEGQAMLHWVSQDKAAFLDGKGMAFDLYPGFDEATYKDMAGREYKESSAPGVLLREQLVYAKTKEGGHVKMLLDAGKSLRVLKLTAFDEHGKPRLERQDIEVVSGAMLDLHEGKVSTIAGHLRWVFDDTQLVLLMMDGSLLCFETLHHGAYAHLLQNAPLRAAMVFEGSAGVRAIDRWTPEEVAELESMVALRERGAPLPFSGPPALVGDRYIAERDAWLCYLAHVAQSLWAEVNHATPWRLSENPDHLAHLFDSRKLLGYTPGPGHSFHTDVMGLVTAWNPALAYDFLRDRVGLGHNQWSTTVRLVDWCRDHLVHFIGFPTAENWERLFGYRGPPPVERMISPLPGREHTTAGCWGTSGFLAAVLRTVNIPVRHGRSEIGSRHSRAEFFLNDKFMIHSDDLLEWNRPPIHRVPTERLFHSGAEIRSLIDAPAVPAGSTRSATAQFNYGRWTVALFVELAADYVMALRCHDRSSGATGPSSRLWGYLNRYYTDAEMAAIAARLDAAIDALPGGCAAVPSLV